MSDRPPYSLLLDWMTESLALAPTTEPVATGVLWNDGGVITLSVGIPPSISDQPDNTSVTEGSTATFSLTATNATSYQWYKQEAGAGAFSAISGATSSSYTTGVLSIASDSTDVYRCVVTGPGGSATSSSAILTVTPNVVTMPSAVVAKMQGIYGTSLLVAEYTGPGVRLRRISDNTQQDFSFTYGELVKADIDSFAGVSQLRIEKWYDQSGNGRDLIASATSTQRPGFRYDSALNPVVTFGDYANMPWIGGPEYMDCATGTFASQNLSVYQVGRWIDQSDSQNHSGPAAWQVHLASNNNYGYGYKARKNVISPVDARFVAIESALGGAFKHTGSGSKSALWANTSLGTYKFRSTSSGTQWKHGAWYSQTSTAGTSATSLTGIRLGAANGTGFRSSAQLTAFMIGSDLTDQEETDCDTASAQIFNSCVTTPTRQVIVEGDSISAAYPGGLYDSREFSWADSVSRSLGNTVLLRNVAISGGHIAGAGDGGTRSLQFGEQAPDKIDTLFNASTFSGVQLLVVWGGTNDISLLSGSSGDATTVHTRLQTYCAARKTANAALKILVVGPIPSGAMTAGQSTELAAYDDLIAANYATYADGYVNMWDQNWTPGGSYATNYLGDQIHPNATGHAKAAALIEPAIRTLLGM